MAPTSTTISTTIVVKKKKPNELLVQQQDDILIITINRPHVKNALNRNAVYELITAVEGATHNSRIKVVVITAAGDYFTAGNDLKQILDQEYRQHEDYFRGANFVLRTLIMTFITCPKLLICLVNGPCIGVGFTLAALCDAVYCTKNAYFQAPFTQLGICPEFCSSLTFHQQFGQSWSTRLLIFGEKLSASKAEELGFVLEVFDNLEVEEKFWSKIREYAKLPAESLCATKGLIKSNNKENLMRALYAELRELEKLRRGTVYKQSVENFIKKSLDKSKL